MRPHLLPTPWLSSQSYQQLNEYFLIDWLIDVQSLSVRLLTQTTEMCKFELNIHRHHIPGYNVTAALSHNGEEEKIHFDGALAGAKEAVKGK